MRCVGAGTCRMRLLLRSRWRRSCSCLRLDPVNKSRLCYRSIRHRDNKSGVLRLFTLKADFTCRKKKGGVLERISVH